MSANEPPGSTSEGPAQHADAQIVEHEHCVVERHVHGHDGRRLVAWIMRPKGEGPFPVVVWNHGSAISMGEGGALVGTPARPTIDFNTPCRPAVTEHGWLYLFPEGRGYGGSEGPDPLVAVRRHDTTLAMVQGRARDTNAAVEWLTQRRDVDARRIAIVGASHGGVVTLLAAAERPYCAAIAQATGAAYGTTELGAVLLHNAAARIRAPLLFQHLETDTLVPIAGARHIYEWAVRFRPQIEWKSYPGVAGIEGHDVGAPGNLEQWAPDYAGFLQKGFAAALDQAPPPPEQPPVLRTDADLPFLLPDSLAADAQVWSGSFTDVQPAIETLLVIESHAAIYVWRQAGSRGYQRTGVERHGDKLVLAPWPGITVTYSPIDDGLLAEFRVGGYVSRARLTRSKLPSVRE